MALSDPLSLAGFADLVRVSEIDFSLQWNQQRSLAGAGDTLYADRAPALWLVTITTPPMEHAEAEGMMAVLNSRGGGLKTILLYNYRMPYPSSDPDGSLFGSATPVVGTIADPLHVAFADFPADYALDLGTYFGVEKSGRRYLGQIAEARTSDGGGSVASVEVAPAFPAFIEEGDPVTVIKPAAKFRLMPGTAHLSHVSVIHTRLSFSAEQTYAA